jgi:hypothetical protein
MESKKGSAGIKMESGLGLPLDGKWSSVPHPMYDCSLASNSSMLSPSHNNR